MFEQLNDKIIEVQVWNFGVIVKRRTILKTLAFVLSLGFLYYIMSANEMPETKPPNLDLTWAKF